MFLKIVFAILGAIAGLAVAILLEVGLLGLLSTLFNTRLTPRGLGWIALPVMGLWGGAVIGYSYETLRRPKFDVSQHFDRTDLRLWVGMTCLWLLAVAIYFLVFDPFGRYRWRSGEWLKFATIALGPPVTGLGMVFVFWWATKKTPRRTASDPSARPVD